MSKFLIPIQKIVIVIVNLAQLILTHKICKVQDLISDHHKKQKKDC